MSVSDWIVVDRALYLTEDGARVVEEADVRGRWLHWPKGARVLRSEYERLYREVEVIELPKSQPPAPNKQRRPQRNK